MTMFWFRQFFLKDRIPYVFLQIINDNNTNGLYSISHIKVKFYSLKIFSDKTNCIPSTGDYIDYLQSLKALYSLSSFFPYKVRYKMQWFENNFFLRAFSENYRLPVELKVKNNLHYCLIKNDRAIGLKTDEKQTFLPFF